AFFMMADACSFLSSLVSASTTNTSLSSFNFLLKSKLTFVSNPSLEKWTPQSLAPVRSSAIIALFLFVSLMSVWQFLASSLILYLPPQPSPTYSQSFCRSCLIHVFFFHDNMNHLFVYLLFSPFER